MVRTLSSGPIQTVDVVRPARLLQRPRRCRAPWILPGILFLGAISASAQRPTRVPTADSRFIAEYWSIEAGLPVNSVTSIMQASSGYIWMTTFDGLIRFDGVRFTVFNEANTPELPTNRFLLVSESADSVLWFHSDVGQVFRWAQGVFERIDEDDGLVGRQVWAARPLDDSTMIIATEEAMNVYGAGRIQHAIGFSTNMAPPTRTDIEVAPDGTAWALLSGTRAARLNGDLTITQLADPIPERVGRIGPIHWLGGNSVLFGAEGGLYQMNDDDLVPILEGEWIRGISQIERTGTVIISGEENIYRYRDGRLAILHSISEEINTADPSIPDIIEGGDGALWYATNQTVYRDAIPVAEIGGAVRGLLRDREGSIWVASATGVHRVQAAQVVSVSPLDTDARSTYGMLETADGTVWMALFGGGLATYRDGRIARYPPESGFPNSLTLSIAPAGDDGLWLGFWGGGACRWSGGQCRHPSTLQEFRYATVRAIHQDRAGDIWIGAENGLFRLSGDTLTRLSTRDGLPHDWVRVVHESPDGTLWFGTNGGGIASYRDSTFHILGLEEGLSSALVRSIHEDDRGILWVGTEGRGLNRLEPDPENPVGYRITIYRRSDGLFDDGIHQILEDNAGRFWMNSNRGIFRIRRSELEAFAAGEVDRVQSIAYQERDGMRNREGNGGVQNAGLVASDGRLWFPTVDGAVVIDPNSIESNRVPPPVVIEVVASAGEIIPAGETVFRVEPHQRDFEVQYTGLSFLAPEHMQFRYQLVGFDREWVDAGNRRTAFFTKVPPGEYTFRVTASNNDGVWNDTGATVTIDVVPRFYETRWFAGLGILGLISLGAGAVRWRVRALERRHTELEREVEERTHELVLEKEASEHSRHEAERQRALAERSRETIESQAQRLMELDEAKSRFFANVSHEFRTPLTLVLGPLQDLLTGMHGDITGETRREVDVAVRNAQRLLRLVNQLLDVSKLEAGRMRLQARELDGARFLRDLALSFTPLAERRRVRFVVDVPDKSISLYADPELLEKVFLNLLSNAFKFTPEGGTVRLCAREAEAETPGGGHLIVTVKDSGPGIAPEHLEHVFERFYRADESTEQRQVGTGIGLSLAKELVELHSGRIVVESEPGFGATFEVKLRCGRRHFTADQIVEDDTPPVVTEVPESVYDETRTPASEPNEAPEANPDVTTVLVADDNAELRAYIRKQLDGPYRVIEAINGTAALELTQEVIPDLVISDVMMPGIDGTELCRAIRADPELEFIPVMLLTARASVESRVTGLEAGADDYLTKPFSVDELRARVDNLIRTRHLLKHRAPPRATVAARPVDANSTDTIFLERLRDAIEADLANADLTVDQVASLVGQSRSNLYRRVRDLLGESPTDLIRSLRLQRAAQLLAQQAGTVSEIAYGVGFKSVSHFCRCFRNAYGATPSQYRTSATLEPADAAPPSAP